MCVCVFLKRRGWSEAANTWEPVENLVQCSDFIDAFEERSFFFLKKIIHFYICFYLQYGFFSFLVLVNQMIECRFSN